MRKLIAGTLLIAILMSGCSNTMADIYGNESKITSDTNSSTDPFTCSSGISDSFFLNNLDIKLIISLFYARKDKNKFLYY